MGRTAAGVRAMRLLNGDEIMSLDVVKPGSELLILHTRGYGKRVPLELYNAKGRNTQGMWTTDHTRLDETGTIVAARVVQPQDQITVMTSNGIALRTAVRNIRRTGRGSRGVRVVNLQDGDTVAAMAILTQEDLSRGVDGGVQDEMPPIELLANGADQELDLAELEAMDRALDEQDAAGEADGDLELADEAAGAK